MSRTDHVGPSIDDAEIVDAAHVDWLPASAKPLDSPRKLVERLGAAMVALSTVETRPPSWRAATGFWNVLEPNTWENTVRVIVVIEPNRCWALRAKTVTTNIPPTFDARPKSRCSRRVSLCATVRTNNCDRLAIR
jgi:hypothetical protein